MASSSTPRVHLDLVVDILDQVIDASLDLLIREMRTTDQVVLNVTREQVLRDLQELVHAEQNAGFPDEHRLWKLVSSTFGATISFLLETLSGSGSYQLGRERGVRNGHHLRSRHLMPMKGVGAQWKSAMQLSF